MCVRMYVCVCVTYISVFVCTYAFRKYVSLYLFFLCTCVYMRVCVHACPCVLNYVIFFFLHSSYTGKEEDELQGDSARMGDFFRRNGNIYMFFSFFLFLLSISYTSMIFSLSIFFFFCFIAANFNRHFRNICILYTYDDSEFLF